MYKHQMQEHEVDPVDHTFTFFKSCTTPLKRQIRKFVVIRQTKERRGNITNENKSSKGPDLWTLEKMLKEKVKKR